MVMRRKYAPAVSRRERGKKDGVRDDDGMGRD